MSETPSFNQITEQHDSGKQATVLVKRTSGEIQTGTYTGIKDTKGRYAVELNEIGDDGHNKWRTTNPEDLTDEAQARFAEELAGKPLRDEASEETTPRELFAGEAHDAAEASAERNEVLSVGAVETLGHDAIEAAGIEEPEENAEDSTEQGAESTEFSDALSESVSELAGKFITGKAELLDELHRDEIRLRDMLGSVDNTLSHGLASNISKESVVNELEQALMTIRSMYTGREEDISRNRTQARQFTGEVEELVERAKRGSQNEGNEVDDTVKLKVRKLIESTEDIENGAHRLASGASDRSELLSRISRVLDELQHDQWGSETAMMSLRQSFQEYERTADLHLSGIMRMREGLDLLGKLRD